MPDDLDDFDLEPTRRQAEEEAVRPYRPDPEKKPSGIFFPATLAVLAVIATALLAVLFFVFRHPSKPKAEPSPALVAAAPARSLTPRATRDVTPPARSRRPVSQDETPTTAGARWQQVRAVRPLREGGSGAPKRAHALPRE